MWGAGSIYRGGVNIGDSGDQEKEFTCHWLNTRKERLGSSRYVMSSCRAAEEHGPKSCASTRLGSFRDGKEKGTPDIKRVAPCSVFR